MAKQTKFLSLKKRPCKIKGGVNHRPEKHGDVDLPAIDLALVNVMLSKAEFETFAGEGTHDALFRKGESHAHEPRFEHFKPLEFKDSFRDCSASVFVGMDENEIEIPEAKLTNVKFSPAVGGLVGMSITVQSLYNPDTMAAFWNHPNAEVHAKLSFGAKDEEKKKKREPELPLNPDDVSNGDGEGDDE